MSDLITTARVNCSLAFETAARHARRLRQDAGQTAAEYMGVLLVVSVIIAAVSTTGIGTDIKNKMSDMVSYIATGDSGKGKGGPAAPVTGNEGGG